MRKKQDRISLRRRSLKRRRMALYIFLFIIGTVIGGALALRDMYKTNPVKRKVSTVIEFTYDGVGRNKMPNGVPFTIDDIKSEKVITRALQRLDLSDKYSAAAITDSVRTKGIFPEDILERVNSYESVYDYDSTGNIIPESFYTTSFEITLFDDFDESLSRAALRRILIAITEEYKEFFLENYVFAMNDDSKARQEFMDSVDYRQQATVVRNRLDTLADYASYLYSVDPGFTLNEATFSDIVVRCRDLENNNLANLDATIMMKVYSKEPDRLRSMYNYLIDQLNNKVTRTKENLNEINKLIEGYEMDDILYIGMGGDSVVAIQSNSVSTYEDLMTKKIEITNNLTEYNAEIEMYKQYLQDLNRDVATDIEIAAAEDAMQNIVDKVNVIEYALKSMITEFNKVNVDHDDIIIGEITYTSPNVISMSYVKRFVKYALPGYLLMFFVFSMNMMIGAAKRLKKEGAAEDDRRRQRRLLKQVDFATKTE